jgi:type IV pilus assembly protein PilV
MKSNCSRSAHAGFTLIEVLVSLVILLVGLLGLAGLQSRSQQAEMESYQRVQALIIIQDMIDRINANRQVVDCYVIATIGTGVAPPGSCAAGTIEQAAMANADMTSWDTMLDGAGETSGGVSIGSMIGARGCIVSLGGNVYQIAVAWQGLHPTVAPNNTCGLNQYGDDNLRRVVVMPVQIADLS